MRIREVLFVFFGSALLLAPGVFLLASVALLAARRYASCETWSRLAMLFCVPVLLLEGTGALRWFAKRGWTPFAARHMSADDLVVFSYGPLVLVAALLARQIAASRGEEARKRARAERLEHAERYMEARTTAAGGGPAPPG